MNIVVIINSASANRRRLALSVVRKKSGGHDVSIKSTSFPGHAKSLAREAVLDGADTIVSVGGDGTTNEIINGMAGSDAVLGIIPAGTANDLPAYHRIPADMERAWEIVLRGNRVDIDLISVNGWRYATAGGLGFPCEVAALADRLRNERRYRIIRRLLGKHLYAAAAVWVSLGYRSRHVTLTLRSNGTEIRTRIFAFMVNNQSFTGKYFFISPGASNGDGLFDSCLIEEVPGFIRPVEVIRHVSRGSHRLLPFVKTWQGSEIEIESDRPVPFMGDGELRSPETGFSICLLPRSLKLIVPEETPL